MKVRYIYSACIEVSNDDLTLLTDPWFTEGIYDGSWYHFPRIQDPLDILEEPDVIYISHIHPDHYDSTFLKQLFARYGEKPVIIPDFENNFLALKTKTDGITALPTTEMRIGNTDIAIFPNLSGSVSDIDSAVLVSDGTNAVLNLNDCEWNDAHVDAIHAYMSRKSISLDLLASGFTGAGPYPQTYFDPISERDALIGEAEGKKQRFFARYQKYCEAFPARYNLPFAGKYLLGGKLAGLNEFRGVADPVEILKIDPKAIVLADGGAGTIDLAADVVGETRDEPYSEADRQSRINEIKNLPLDYEREIQIPFEKINFARLVRAAYGKAIVRSEVATDYYYILNVQAPENRANSFILNANKEAPEISSWETGIYPDADYSELFIDYRYAFGLLTGLYHWNNAEVGSQITTRRRPGTNFHRPAQAFLNFMATC